MNAERLHAVALRLIDRLEAAEVVPQMEAMHQALSSLAQNAAEPSAQQSLADSRSALGQRLAEPTMNDWTEADRQVLAQLGVDDWVGERLLAQIEEVLTRNEITFVVARDEFAPLLEETRGKLNALTNLTDAMGALGLPAGELGDDFEVVVVIPRREVHDHLGELADEFHELEFIFHQFQQLATGESAPISVREIASSDFGLFVAAAPAWAYALAKAIQVIVDTYNGILDIRLKRNQLAEGGVPEPVLAPLAEHANGVMTQTLDDLRDELREEFSASAQHNEQRLNELSNGIGFALNKLANRVDAGFSFDVRAPDVAEEDEDEEGGPNEMAPGEVSPEQRYVGLIRESAQSFRYFEASSGRILELPEASDSLEPGPELHDEPPEDVG